MSYAGLPVQEGDFKFTFEMRMPAKKLDPAKCAMQAVDANAAVAFENTVNAAGGGGAVGTELPPDQEL
jgi:hypothetical protein